MAITVMVNGITLTHRGSQGTSIATLPNVCKTPSPGGPVPIPYPSIARTSALKKGTKMVKANGQMAAVKGSEYSRSNGDEAGTLGGVASSTHMKESTWITHSFDVSMEGKKACRISDKMMCNHQNTVCLGGNVDAYITARDGLQTAIDECDKIENVKWDNEHPGGPKHDNCRAGSGKKSTYYHKASKTTKTWEKPVQVELGIRKEQCVNSKIADTDRLKKQRRYNADGTPYTKGSKEGSSVPDFVLLAGGGKVVAVLEVKFPCPSGKGKKGQWRFGQDKKYKKAFNCVLKLMSPR